MKGIKQEMLITYYVSSKEEDSMPYWVYQKNNHGGKGFAG